MFFVIFKCNYIFVVGRLLLTDFHSRIAALTEASSKGQAVDNSQFLQEIRTNIGTIQNEIRVTYAKAQVNVCPC